MKDYESARIYLAKYLDEKGSNAAAHKLNGQIFEKLNQPETALGCYIRSYEIKPSNDLVWKICGLMTDIPVKPELARYWAEVGERSIPHSVDVCKLRDGLLAAGEGENRPDLKGVPLQKIKPADDDDVDGFSLWDTMSASSSMSVSEEEIEDSHPFIYEKEILLSDRGMGIVLGKPSFEKFN